MKVAKLLSACALVGVLSACGNPDVRYYRVVIDESALAPGTAPVACYTGNTAPTTTSTTENLRTWHEWSMWEGADGKKYLDLTTTTFASGRGPFGATTGQVLESKDGKSYTATQTTVSAPPGGPTSTLVDTTVVTFTDTGSVLEGNIKVQQTFTCTNCPGVETYDCAPGDMPFNGRQVTYQGTHETGKPAP